MSERTARRLIARARAARMASPGLGYPRWYLKRWHYLPEGYLSRRSVRAYALLTRLVYNAGRDDRVRRRVVEALRRDGRTRIVELGCGPGLLLRDIADALPAERIVGVDLSPYALEAADDRLAGEAQLLHADARQTGLEAETFDAVVAVHVLGHVPEPVAEGLLAEAERLLAPGGSLYIVEHRWHSLPDAPGLAAGAVHRLLGGVHQMVTRVRRPAYE